MPPVKGPIRFTVDRRFCLRTGRIGAALRAVAISLTLSGAVTLPLSFLAAQNQNQNTDDRTDVAGTTAGNEFETHQARVNSIRSAEMRADAENKFRYARELHADGFRERALALYKQFVILYPRHTRYFDALKEIGTILDEMDRPEEAAQYYMRAFREAPNHEEGALAYLQAGRLLANIGRTTEARAIYAEIRRVHPGSRAARLADLEIRSLRRNVPAGDQEGALFPEYGDTESGANTNSDSIEESRSTNDGMNADGSDRGINSNSTGDSSRMDATDSGQRAGNRDDRNNSTGNAVTDAAADEGNNPGVRDRSNNSTRSAGNNESNRDSSETGRSDMTERDTRAHGGLSDSALDRMGEGVEMPAQSR